MGIRKPVNRELNVIAAICLGLFAGNRGFAQAAQPQAAQQPSAQTVAARPVGTIKSISGNTIRLTNDVGVDVTVLVQDAAKLLRIAPGQKDLKRSEEHTSELQSLAYLVCRLLLEKKKRPT